MTDAQILDRLEKAEGWPAFTSKANDPPTKGGITLETLRVWRRDPTVTVQQLRALERPEARAIYQFMFLQPFQAIVDEELRYYLIDLGVLRGPRRAAMMLQDIVGARPADGWIGPKTLKAMEPFRKHLVAMLVGSRFTHIEQHVREQPEDEEYRNGWRNRNAGFLK